MTNQHSISSQISHDLHNYIGGIYGLANIIAEDMASYIKRQEARGVKADKNLKEVVEFANMLASYSLEALEYVDDLLNSSLKQSENKIDEPMRSGFTLGELKDCGVGILLKELIIFNEPLILKHKVFVKTNIQENLPKLKSNISRLKQILINLITNAVKYSHEGGLITISVYCLDGQIFIEIADQGIGMTNQELVMALVGYGTQIDKSNLNKNAPLDSHGLGMSIVKQLMELMQGEMRIESTKGIGTKVILSFAINKDV